MKKQFFTFLLLFSIFTGQAKAQETEALPSFSPRGSLSLRSNTISLVMLTPSLGAEYKATDNLGLLVDGAWSHWNLDTQNRYWRMWNVAPQVRYYTGKLKDNYIGLQYTMGEYNLTGDQGKYMGGGISLGHQFYLGKNLMADLGLSLGYLYLHDKEKYERTEGHNYRTEAKNSHGYWGLTGLSITFVWKIN